MKACYLYVVCTFALHYIERTYHKKKMQQVFTHKYVFGESRYHYIFSEFGEPKLASLVKKNQTLLSAHTSK